MENQIVTIYRVQIDDTLNACLIKKIFLKENKTRKIMIKTNNSHLNK